MAKKIYNIIENVALEMHDDGTVALYGTYPFKCSMGRHPIDVEVVTTTAVLEERGIAYDNPGDLAHVLAEGNIQGDNFWPERTEQNTAS